MKTVAFHTLGCKVNQYETQALCELFEKAGYDQVEFEKKADVYVINTCSVTGMSDRKSRKMIHRAKKANPEAVVVVTGCYAQTAPDAVLELEGVNLVVGTKDRAGLVERVEELTAQDKQTAVGDIMQAHAFEELSVESYTERSRAYIKIQEGCNQFCSYCIIPYARGPIRSRLPEKVVEEARRLTENGFCELVLVGIHVASYGLDLGGTDLADIISKIDEIPAVKRIRLSSIEPMTLNKAFIDAIKPYKKLCPHFHISLQSGCDQTLKRMRRKYTTEEFKGIVEGLRDAFADVAVTTDIMVGFPGETDREFQCSYDFAKEVDFADMHVFSYSPRTGTPAAKMAEQIDARVKHARSEKMIELASEMQQRFIKQFVGKTMEVLFEQSVPGREGWYEGKTANYLFVAVRADRDLTGKLLPVKLADTEGTVLIGSI